MEVLVFRPSAPHVNPEFVFEHRIYINNNEAEGLFNIIFGKIL